MSSCRVIYFILNIQFLRPVYWKVHVLLNAQLKYLYRYREICFKSQYRGIGGRGGSFGNCFFVYGGKSGSNVIYLHVRYSVFQNLLFKSPSIIPGMVLAFLSDISGSCRGGFVSGILFWSIGLAVCVHATLFPSGSVIPPISSFFFKIFWLPVDTWVYMWILRWLFLFLKTHTHTVGILISIALNL